MTSMNIFDEYNRSEPISRDSSIPSSSPYTLLLDCDIRLGLQKPVHFAQKRIDFLIYELKTEVNLDLPPVQSIREVLNFLDKHDPSSPLPDKNCTYDHFSAATALQQKKWSMSLWLIFFHHICHRLGQDLHFTFLANELFLKLLWNKETYFLSPFRQEGFLNLHQVYELLAKHEQDLCSRQWTKYPCLESYDPTLICDLILQKQYDCLIQLTSWESAIKVLDCRFSLKPNSMSLLAQKLSLVFQLEDYEKASRLLERYLTFCDLNKSPAEIQQIYLFLRQNRWLDKQLR